MLRKLASKHLETTLLALILLTGLGLRLWGIDFDLPYIYHPDEPARIAISQRMLKTGDLNPHFFNYPSLFIYLNLLAYVPYFLFGKLLGVFQSPGDILEPVQLTMGVTYAPMPTAVLLGRLVTVTFGVGSVILVFLTGRRLRGGMWAGLLATLFMAASPTNVQHSHWITPDTTAVFFTVAAVYASILVFQEGRTWQYILAGVCIGLAASTKYNAGLVIASLVAAHFLRHGGGGFKERNLYIGLVLSGLAFLMTTPFAILELPEFLADLQVVAGHYSTGHPGMEGDTLQWYLLSLWRTTGPLFLIASVATLYGIVTRSREMVLIAVFPLVYFLFISRFVVRNDRTLLPLTPSLFLLASSLLVLLIKLVAKLRSRPWAATLAFVLSATLIASLAISAGPLISFIDRLNTVDSRETARQWIDNSLPPGATVAIEPYAPFVDPSRFQVQGLGSMIDHSPDWYIEQGFEYLVFGEGMFGRFYREPEKYETEISEYDGLFDQFELLRLFTDGGYEVRIYHVTEK